MLKRRDTMLKGHGSGVVLKRHRSSVELLPHDVLELIFERLPVKPLLRFRAVSKKWKTTIDSRRFQERQLIRRKQSRGPDVLFVALSDFGVFGDDDGVNTRIRFGSSIACSFKFHTSGSIICNGTCDGLVCLYCIYEPSVVVNPSTRWHQTFPLSNVQQLFLDSYDKGEYHLATPRLGFGKDKFRGTYKPVWLYNSSDYGLDNVTTCEVYDFTTSAWRYVVPASPCRIDDCHDPVYLDGSLYWLTECEETKVLSFDLHTETFQVISTAPFSHVRDFANVPNPFRSVMLCILDNCLCASERNCHTQLIWSFDSSGKTWKQLCSIDLAKTLSWFVEPSFPLLPIAILDENKLLLQGNGGLQSLVVHDLHANSFDLLFRPTRPIGPVSYFQSLFSALSN